MSKHFVQPYFLWTVPSISTPTHGHLLFLTRRRQILVVNFITGFQITSPVLPLDHHPPSADSRLALLTAPVSSPDCTLIFLTFDKLFLWKINSSPDWFYRPLRVRLTKLRQMMVVGSRILVVGRKVWALEFRSMLSIKEFPLYLCPKELVVQCLMQNILPSVDFEYAQAQFVDSEGEILYVCFTRTSDLEIIYKVEVFRVDMLDDHMILVKKDNLGNRALFLSMAVNVPGCVCNNPERWGGENNYIYYARDGSWYMLEVGGFAPRNEGFAPWEDKMYQSTHAKCFHPFWAYPSII